jgi:hypothetical protein
LLKSQAIDGKEVRKSSINILDAKSEQKKVRVPKIKKDLPLSKKEIKPRCSLGLPRWKENKVERKGLGLASYKECSSSEG